MKKEIDIKERDQFAIEFANWLGGLLPSQKVSVWSKNGEYKGLFTMDNEQLLEKFIALNEKGCKQMRLTIEQIISMNDFDNKQLNQRLAEMPKEYTIDDILDCDEKKNCITIKSIGSNYHIDLGRIKNKGDLLDTVVNLCRKNGMNAYLIKEFIERVETMKRKTGW